jgi:trimeric autotransporter adhesin
MRSSASKRCALTACFLCTLTTAGDAQVVVAPNAPALRVLCVGTTGTLSFDANSPTTCAGPQTNITGITVSNGTGVTATGTAGVSVTGTGGIAVNSGNITTSTGNVTAGGTVQGASVRSTGATEVGTTLRVNGTTTLIGAATTNGVTNTGNITTTTLGANKVTATTVVASTVNSSNIDNSGTTKTNSLVVGGGGLSIASGAPVDVGHNRIQNVGAPVAATDAVNKAYVDREFGLARDQINEAFRKIDENTEGIAIAIAMGGLALPTNKTFALGANVGFYDSKQAVAVQTVIRIDDAIALNGGLGVGFEGGKVGARIGIMAAW